MFEGPAVPRSLLDHRQVHIRVLEEVEREIPIVAHADLDASHLPDVYAGGSVD